MVERIVPGHSNAAHRAVERQHERRISCGQSIIRTHIGYSSHSGQAISRRSVCAEIVRSEAAMTRVHAYRRNSHEIALVMMGSDGAGQPTERWQDKSREVRGGRSVGKRAMIKDLAQCAPAHESLPICTS